MDAEALLQVVWLVIIVVWALAARFLKRRKSQAAERPEMRDERAPTQAPMGELGELVERLRQALVPEEAGDQPALQEEPVGSTLATVDGKLPQPEGIVIERLSVEREPVEHLPSAPLVSAGAPAPRRRRSRPRSWLVRELRGDGASLARAMVLREVLGPPVALRSQLERAPFGTTESN